MTAYTEKQYVEEMIATRRKIHQTPEEGWTEFQTTWLVAERLRALGLKVLLGTQVINPKAVTTKRRNSPKTAMKTSRKAPKTLTTRPRTALSKVPAQLGTDSRKPGLL